MQSITPSFSAARSAATSAASRSGGALFSGRSLPPPSASARAEGWRGTSGGGPNPRGSGGGIPTAPPPAGTQRLAQEEADRRLVVGEGIGVRHGAPGGDPARRGGPGAARDRLDVFVARLSQVDVHVHEPGDHDVAPHLPHLGAVGSAEPRADRGDLAVLNEDIRGLVEAPARVDHAATAQDERPHHSGAPDRFAASPSSGRPPARRYNTAIRTATPFVT